MLPSWLSKAPCAAVLKAADDDVRPTGGPTIASPRSSRAPDTTTTPQRTVAESSTQNVAKQPVPSQATTPDIMEHFPLLPLGLIPTLDSHVLADCKVKLQALLQTLTDDPDDVSLGHYVKKEVAVIVTEIEDRRARQRIADLVLGVQTTSLIEIGAKASDHITKSTGQNQQTAVRAPAASPTRPSQLTPTQNTSIQASALSATTKLTVSKPAPSTKAPETTTPDASYGAPRRLSIKEMLAKAKVSRVAANDPSVRFIIQNTGSLKLKKRGKAKPKAPKEETPEERLQKQKELRRQAAHDRLVARQAKMALKKQQELARRKALKEAAIAQHQDDASSDSASDIDAASSDSDEYVDDAVHHEVPIDLLPDPMPRVEVETDDRITRINNTLCSIQAAENLARIRSVGTGCHTVARPLEEVQLPTPNATTAQTNHEGSETSAAPTTDPSGRSSPVSPSKIDCNREMANDLETPSPEKHTDNRLVLNGPSNEDGTTRVDNEPQCSRDDDDTLLPSHSSNKRCDVESTAGDSDDNDDDNEMEHEEAAPPYVPPVYDKSTFHSSIPMQLLENALDKMIKTQETVTPPLPEWFQAQRESVEKLVTPRATIPSPRPAQSMGQARQILHDLVASQNQIKSYQASVESTLASLAPPPPRVSTPELALPTLRPKSSKPRLAPRPTAARNNNDSNNQETNEPTLRRSAKSTPRLHVKAAPVVPLVKSMPPVSMVDYSKYYKNFLCIMTSFYEKSSTANPKEALLQGETALRFQLKLYTIWKNVMHDYATVFGVDGLLKTSRAASYVYDGAQSTPFTAQYRINSSSRLEVFGIVAQALKRLPDWEELPVDLGLNTTWNILWTWSKPRVDRQTLLVWQKVNHFAGAKALTRKDMLKKSLHRYTSLGGERLKSFDIAPETFILPNDYIPFVQAFKKRGDAIGQAKNVWIMKPVALSRGRGISLLNDLGQVAYGEAVVVQKYIENPLLLDGFKFDLRLYVLVTSFNPLEAFFYQEGFVRICTHRYSSDATDINDLFMHLTNSSIQKYGDMDQVAYVLLVGSRDNPVNNASTTEAGGTKASLAYLWSRLAAVHAPVEQIKEDIIHVILKSLVAGEDAIPYQVNSFDVFGYDILLDEAYRPWLIEINSSPSMARENNLDYVIKDALMHDTMRVVQPLHFDRAALIAILQRRLDDIAKERKRPNLLHPLEAEERTKRQLNADLHDILHGAVPREYGELPDELGNFLRIAPSPWHNTVMKLKRNCFRDKTPKT